MKDNIENFREITEIVLKDIYVTDELKQKTLEKCTAKSQLKIHPAILSTASAAVLIIGLGFYNYSFKQSNVAVNNPIQNEYKDPVNKNDSSPAQIVAETKSEPEVKNTEAADKPVDLGNRNENKDVAIQQLNNTTGSSSSVSISDTKHGSVVTTQGQALSSSIKPLNIADAEKYFEGSIHFPKYIPDGFILKSISIPDDKLKCIKLKYSTRTAYFEIIENKSLPESNSEYITSEKTKSYTSYTTDENSNTITTITWTNNDIQYSVSGNLPESLIINITKYLK
ncbi:MAG: hypothetical protein ACM3X7_04910 [Solirubrobacterales bacterium]